MFHNRLCFHFRLADLCRQLCAIIQVLIAAEILVHHSINKVINFSNSNYWWLLTEIFTLVLSNITQKGYPGWWKVQSKFPCNLSNWKQQDIKAAVTCSYKLWSYCLILWCKESDIPQDWPFMPKDSPDFEGVCFSSICPLFSRNDQKVTK